MGNVLQSTFQQLFSYSSIDQYMLGVSVQGFSIQRGCSPVDTVEKT